jgi:hypothetical protein
MRFIGGCGDVDTSVGWSTVAASTPSLIGGGRPGGACTGADVRNLEPFNLLLDHLYGLTPVGR